MCRRICKECTMVARPASTDVIQLLGGTCSPSVYHAIVVTTFSDPTIQLSAQRLFPKVRAANKYFLLLLTLPSSQIALFF